MNEKDNVSSELKREIQLDIIRGLAVVMVVLYHFTAPTGHPAFDTAMSLFLKVGWAGVDVFFVLSGFLIGRIILSEMRATGAFSYKHFILRRAFRLWPILYLFLLVKLIFDNDPWYAFIPQNFFHVQNYFVTPVAHLWSLAVEEHFYIVVALVLPFFARKGTSHEKFLASLFGIMAGCLILRFIGYFAGAAPFDLRFQTQYRLDGLAAGVTLAIIYLYYPKLFRKLQEYRAAFAGVTLLGAAALYIGSDNAFFAGTISYSIAWICGAAMILSVSNFPIPKVIYPAAWVMAMVGVFSYSIYIWHVAIGHRAGSIFTRLTHISDPRVDIAVMFVGAIGGGCVISALIERPILALRGRLFPKPRTPS